MTRQSPYTHDAAKAAVLDALARNAALHEQGAYAAIGAQFDELDGRVPRDGGSIFDTLLVALRFLDDWQDARNHDWRYHEPVGQADWPVLARTLIDDIAADRELGHPVIRRHFVGKR